MGSEMMTNLRGALVNQAVSNFGQYMQLNAWIECFTAFTGLVQLVYMPHLGGTTY